MTFSIFKEVGALKIEKVIINTETKEATLDFGKGRDYPVSKEYMEKHKPQIGGYFVVYKDGYQSFSPAEAFEDGYSLVSTPIQEPVIRSEEERLFQTNVNRIKRNIKEHENKIKILTTELSGSEEKLEKLIKDREGSANT